VRERRDGDSYFGLARLIWLAVTGLTAFSMVPLRAVSFAGVAVSVIAFASGVGIVYEYLVEGIKIPGFFTLAVGLAFLSGVQLLAIGVFAEYLGRVYEEVKQRPLYVIAEELSSIACADVNYAEATDSDMRALCVRS
jgi:polyisoprenyl-phosphate glycosyltransferase